MEPPTLILVVDDDARSVNRLAIMLREDGYEVETELDGEAAIQRLSRAPAPAVLVTDLHLPRGNGAEVARFARAHVADMPVVVVTGYPQLAPLDLTPAPIVLTKPLVYRDLSAALARVAAARA